MQKKWIQIVLFDSKNRQTQEADEPQILFVLQGEAELTLGHTVKAYRAEEFHMVNVLQRYELRMKQPGGCMPDQPEYGKNPGTGESESVGVSM